MYSFTDKEVEVLNNMLSITYKNFQEIEDKKMDKKLLNKKLRLSNKKLINKEIKNL